MRNLHIRKATPEDMKLCAEWLSRIADKSELDVNVLGYPATELLCVYDFNTGEPRLFVPVQPLFVIESLGPAPDIQPMEMAEALKRVVHTLAWEGRTKGHGELMFPCSDESVIALGERHGFEKLPFPVLRMRL